MIRYLITCTATSVQGTQTFYVDAENEAEALAKFDEQGGEFYCEELEVQDLGKGDISGATDMDDTGDSPFAPTNQVIAAQPDNGRIYKAWIAVGADLRGLIWGDFAKHLEKQGIVTQSDSAQFERMFMSACEDLGAINEALGLDPDDAGAEPILSAIEELKSNAAQPDSKDAEFLSKRLARVATLAGVPMPDMTHAEIVKVAGTILGQIARNISLRSQINNDTARYEYLINYEYIATKRYLPDLNEAEYKAKLRAKHDAAIAASKSKGNGE